MRTPRSHLPLLALLACVPLAGCGSSGDRASSTSARAGSPGTSSIAGTVTSGSSSTAAGGGGLAGGRSVAAAFAAGYARFLDGGLPAGRLPVATSAARVQALAGGPIPAAERRGALRIVSLRLGQGSANVWALGARDLAHTFYASITVGAVAGRPLVVGVQTPDYAQIFARTTPPPPQPAGSAAAERAAREFLSGYLPWQYGNGRVQTIGDLTGALRASLQANPPRVPPSVRSLHPRVRSLAMQHASGGGWEALPVIFDGQQTYEVVLTVRQFGGRWLVSAVGPPR